MVGRGTIGQPWLLRQLSESMYGYGISKKSNSMLMSELVKLHFDKTLDYYGIRIGVRVFRKHLAKYLKNTDVTQAQRYSLITEESIKTIRRNIQFVFNHRKVKIADEHS